MTKAEERDGNAKNDVEKDNKIIIYELQGDQFEELEIDDSIDLLDLLHPTGVFLFMDENLRKGFLWFGRRANLRDKFVSAKESLVIKDKHPSIWRVKTEEALTESKEFKKWIGILEERDLNDLKDGVKKDDYSSVIKKILEIYQSKDDFITQSVSTLKYLMKAKAKGYFFWTSEGDLKQADLMYQQWEAYAQLCQALGIPHESINDEGNGE